MKYTLNIYTALLERVISVTGAATKTEAIHVALREVDRRAHLVERLRAGTGVSSDDEIRNLFGSPRRESSLETLRVAEDAAPYTTKGLKG